MKQNLSLDTDPMKCVGCRRRWRQDTRGAASWQCRADRFTCGWRITRERRGEL